MGAGTDEFLRKLNERPKAQCVAAEVFNTDRGIDRVRNQFPPSIPARKIGAFLASKRRSFPTSDVERVLRNIRWTFQAVGSGSTVPPGRFNKANEAALYTAKESETAKAERFTYIGDITKPFDYIVFETNATGTMLDIRDDAAAFYHVKVEEHNHPDCQQFASNLRTERGISGIISQSVWNQGGSCCTFFTLSGISPSTVKEIGTYIVDDKPVA